jgi:putative transposase
MLIPKKELAMPEKISPIKLSEEERQQLQKYVKQGKKSARAMNRARILLLVDEQQTDEEIAKILGVNRTTIYRVRKEYRAVGVNNALEEKPRSGAPAKIDGRVEATLTMLAWSEPPEGHGRWTLQLLADKLVELAVVESISLPTGRTALKKTNLSLG